MLSLDQYTLNAVEYVLNAWAVMEIGQKNVLCLQEHIRLVNINVELMNTIKEKENYAFIYLLGMLIARAIIKQDQNNVYRNLRHKYKLVRIKPSEFQSRLKRLDQL